MATRTRRFDARAQLRGTLPPALASPSPVRVICGGRATGGCRSYSANNSIYSAIDGDGGGDGNGDEWRPLMMAMGGWEKRVWMHTARRQKGRTARLLDLQAARRPWGRCCKAVQSRRMCRCGRVGKWGG